MLCAELDYHLPPRLVAQEPASPRDNSRLMRLRRDSGAVAHHRFHELPGLLRAGDLLVFNDTRVLHARLRGRKECGGGRVEALLLREVEQNLWEALLKPSSRIKPGAGVIFEAPRGELRVPARALERTAAGWLLRFTHPSRDVRDLLPTLGQLPVPLYIKRPLLDDSQYQTVYASDAAAGGAPGAALDSAAAPTAGLHFSTQVLQALRAAGVATASVTLAVGIGTFRPIQTETLEAHTMHEEAFDIPAATASAIGAQRDRGGRVVAVGTTTTRVLETVADASGRVHSGRGSSRIFIQPGYRFRCVDALLTNFHLPRSSLLAMVAAFAQSGAAPVAGSGSALTGLEKIRYAYSQAVQSEYRFFSLGDAMLID